MKKDLKIPIIDIKKYGGKQVAVLNGRIIASGRTLAEVVRQVRTLFPSKPLEQIHIFSVPKTLSVIYHA